MKKVSFGNLQKLFGNSRRAFGERTQSSAPADQPHRKVPRKNFWAIGAGVLGVSYCGVGAHIV